MDFREVGDHYDRFQSMEGPLAEDRAVAVMFSMAYGDVAGHLRDIDVTQSLGSEAQTLLQWQRRHDNHYAFYSVFGFGGIIRCIPQIIAAIDDDGIRPFTPVVKAMRAEATADLVTWIERTGLAGPDVTANDVARAEVCLEELRWEGTRAGAPEQLWTSGMCRRVLLVRYGIDGDLLDQLPLA